MIVDDFIDTKKRVLQAVKAGIEVLSRPVPMSLSTWADQNYYLSSESAYIEGQWETINYQKTIMDCISNDDIERVTFIKSARVGYTKMLLAAMGYFLEHKKRNQLVFLPNDEPAKVFMRQSIEPMIRDVPSIKRLAPWFSRKDKASTEKYKLFSNGKVMHVRGGGAAKNYRELSVDVVIYDELDAFPNNVENEGSPLTLGDKRTEGSIFKKSIRGSTPKMARTSLVKASADTAPHKFRFHIPCPHCQSLKPLEFGGKHVAHGFKWVGDDPETVRHACIECGAMSTYAEMQVAQDRGRWQTDEGIWIDEDCRFRTPDNDYIPTPRDVTFHIWTAYSPFTTWTTIVREWLEAKDDITKLRTFINTTLGEAFEEMGERADENELLARVEDYATEPLPEGAEILVAGVDTQKDRLEMQVIAVGRGDEMWVVDYIVIPGDPNTPAPWISLDYVLARVYTRADGIRLRVARTCVDTGGTATQSVYQYVKTRLHLGVLGIKGVDGEGRPIIGMPTKSNLARINLFPVGGMTVKDLIFARLQIKEYGPGYIHFKKGLCNERYFSGLTAEEVKYKNVEGVPKRMYVKIPGRSNEQLDTMVYAFAAYSSLNVSVDEMFDAQPNATERKVRAEMSPTE